MTRGLVIVGLTNSHLVTAETYLRFGGAVAELNTLPQRELVYSESTAPAILT